MKTKILICLLILIGSYSMLARGQDDYWFKKGVNAKDYKKQIEYFTKSLKADGPKVETYLLRGDAYWYLGLDAVYNHRKIIIVFNKDNVDFHNGKLMYKKAIEDYTKAMNIDSNCAKAYISRSDVYWQLGQNDKALADLSRLIEIDSNNVEAYSKRSFIYRNNFRDQEKALADINKVIQIDPKDKYAYQSRGTLNYELKRYENAIVDFNIAIENDPGSSYAYCYRGNVYRSIGQYDKAISDYNHAIDADHKNFIAYHNRGYICLIQSQYEDALRDFHKTISLEHNFPFAFNNIGYIYLQQNKIDLAIENFNKCLAVDNKTFAANLNLAMVYYRSGDKEKAKAYLDRTKEILPSLLENADVILKSNNGWYYWTEKDQQTLGAMLVELK